MKTLNHFGVWITIAISAVMYFEYISLNVHWIFFWGIVFEIFDRELLRPIMLKQKSVIIKHED